MTSENIDGFNEFLFEEQPAEDLANKAALGLPGGKEFSSEIGSDARHWLHYREAYIGGIDDQLSAIAGPVRRELEPALDDYARKMRIRHQQHAKIYQKVVDEQDSLYIHTFAALEVERVRCQAAGEILFDPLELEYEFSLLTLRKVLDELLESSLDAPDDYRQTRQSQVISSDQPLAYIISRIRSGQTTTYVVKEHARRDQRTESDQSDQLLHVATYGLTDSGQNHQLTFTATSRHEARPTSSSYDVLQLAASVLLY